MRRLAIKYACAKALIDSIKKIYLKSKSINRFKTLITTKKKYFWEFKRKSISSISLTKGSSVKFKFKYKKKRTLIIKLWINFSCAWQSSPYCIHLTPLLLMGMGNKEQLGNSEMMKILFTMGTLLYRKCIRFAQSKLLPLKSGQQMKRLKEDEASCIMLIGETR